MQAPTSGSTSSSRQSNVNSYVALPLASTTEPADSVTPERSRCARMSEPWSSLPSLVTSVVSTPRRARPRATLAGLPPGWATGDSAP